MKITEGSETCILCHGTGLMQKFDKKKNKWVKSDETCEMCKGKGQRKFIIYSTGYEFVNGRKVYLVE